jgi:predicted nucleic acid-binding protein
MVDTGQSDRSRGADTVDLTAAAFVDASALVALADRDDRSHDAAVQAYRELRDGGFWLFTTDLALAAAHELLTVALGHDLARSWLARCHLPVYGITPAELDQGRAMVGEATAFPTIDLADAVHLAVLDRLGVTDVFAVDRRFLALLG